MTLDYLKLKAIDFVDDEFIRSYDTMMSLVIPDYKETGAIKEWKIGDHCRAIYHGDGYFYEAKIIDINGEGCVVDFLGYNEEAEVKLNMLRESGGEKVIKEQKEKAEKSSLRESWKVGDNCRAVYHGDNLFYEVKIIQINNDECTVEFLGYDEEAKVKLDSLEKSNGRKAIHEQKEKARKILFPDTDDNRSDDDSRHEYYRTCNPHYSRKCRRSINGKMHDRSLNSAAFEMPHTIAFPPPVLPLCAEITSLNAMLTAWYMAGYYMGSYGAKKNAPHRICCCCRANNNQ